MINNINTKNERKNILYGTYISSTEDMLNTFVIRILIDNEENEYRFYNVLEYSQFQNTEIEDFSLTKSNSRDIIEKSNINNLDLPTDLQLTDINHFTFLVQNYRFEIFAEGFVIDKEFSISYCEQDLIKKHML
jgi:hypothetical protein